MSAKEREARTRRRRIVGGTIGAVLVASTFGCATSRSGIYPQGGIGEDERRVTIEVVNLNHGLATLHAWYEGRRQRLGQLRGGGETVYELPLDLPRQLHLEIRVVAQGRCVTSQLYVDPGDILYLEIPSERLFRSRRLCAE